MILVSLSTVIDNGIAALKASKPVGFYYQDADFLKIIEDEINAHAAVGERFCGLLHSHCEGKGVIMAFQPLQGKHAVRLIQFPEFNQLTTIEDTFKLIESQGQMLCSFVLQGFHPIYVFQQSS